MKVVPKKQWRYPLSLERTYAKLLVAHVQRMFKVIHAFLPEMRDVILRYAVKLDADDDNTMVNAHIDILIDQLRRAMENHTAMLPVIRRTFDQVDRYNLQEWDAVMKSVFGVPIRSQSVPAMKQDADEDDVAKLKDIWVQQNLDLISSIDEETMQKIRDRMAERIIQNVDSSSLTRYLIQDIKDIAGVEVNRATLIGADQVGKLNGRLSQFRQQHAGLGEYQWNSCHDSRVRPAHAARSGHVYSWGNPPPDGNPGHPIRCRCVALPVIDLDKIAIRLKKNSFVSAISNGIIGETGAIRANSKRGIEHAIRYYESVRHMSTDCAHMSKNTGFREADIQLIKQHVFIQEHDLLDGHHRFYEDYEMAQSWQRLIEGNNIQNLDIILLNHEYLELTFMKDGMSQSEAHDKADTVYNYGLALKEAER